MQEDKLSEEFKNKSRIEISDIKKIFGTIFGRERFQYSFKSIIMYLVHCLCLRRDESFKDIPSLREHYLFDKASSKFSAELDIVNIVKTLRKFKLFAQAKLDQRHRMLLRF